MIVHGILAFDVDLGSCDAGGETVSAAVIEEGGGGYTLSVSVNGMVTFCACVRLQTNVYVME